MKIFFTFAFSVLVLVTQASAQIEGTFVNEGEINGATVFSFNITPPGDVTTFDFTEASGGGGFTGNFNNTGNDTNFDLIPDAPLTFAPVIGQPGPLQETFFNVSPVGLSPALVVDSVGPGTELQAIFSAGGGVLAPGGVSTPIAFFSTSDGLEPTLLGGAAVIDGELFTITAGAVGPTVVFDPISGEEIFLSFDEPSSVIGITGGETELVDLQDPTGIFSVVDNGTSVEVSLNEAFDFSTIAPGTLSEATLSITAGGETATFGIATNAPEPTSIALIGLGLAGVVARRRRV